jgi:hypothetical protein
VVTNTAAGAATTLTIPPAVTTTVEQVLTSGTAARTLSIISISAAQNAILKPGYVSGATGIILGDNLYLDAMDSGKITVADGSNIAVTALTDLGSNNTTQSAVMGKIRGGKLTFGNNLTPIINEPIIINTTVVTAGTGGLTIAADTTINVPPTLTGTGPITINTGRNLIIASEVAIARGAVLSLTEGVYQAVGANAVIPIGGTFTAPATVDAGLKIGASVADIATNYISLTSAAGGAATFTPTVADPAAPVVFGKEGITLAGGASDPCTFTVSGTLAGRITVAGTGVNITLGADATNSGLLGLLEGAFLVAADSLEADDGTSPPIAGDYATQGTLKAEQNTGSDGIDITARTVADGAVITSATKSTN